MGITDAIGRVDSFRRREPAEAVSYRPADGEKGMARKEGGKQRRKKIVLRPEITGKIHKK